MRQTVKESFIEIDGTFGEGGGSIVRTATIMSALTGQPFQLKGVRGALQKKGLNSVDMCLIHVLTKATKAVHDAAFGLSEFKFSPTKPIGFVKERIDLSSFSKSAIPGSATLVLQSLMVPLCRSGAISQVVCKGGTHVHYAPSFDYFRLVALPAFAAAGVFALPTIETASYSPKSVGEVSLEIEPSELNGFDFRKRGKQLSLRAVIATSELPESVGLRGIRAIQQKCSEQSMTVKVDFVKYRSSSPGACVSFGGVFENGFGGSQAIGERGLPIEEVVENALSSFVHWLNSESGVDEFLADQLLLPAVLAREESYFTCSKVTPTLTTTAWVIKQFMPARITIIGQEGEPGTVQIAK